MDVQDPYLVPLEDPTRTDPSKEGQASDPYLTPLKDPKRTELSDEEQAALTEKGIEKLRTQGFSEPVLWSLQAPGGSWTDLAVNVGGGIAGSIGGGVLGAAAGPVGVGVGAAAGGASAGGLADYWSQLREYAREGGGDEDFKLKKGRLGASVVLGGIVPAPVKALRPVTDLPSRAILKNIPNPNAARDILGPGLQRTLAERLPGEFAQDAANYAMTRGAQGAVMAAGQNVAEQVIDRPANEDFSFGELGLSALGGAGVGAVFGAAERSAPPTLAWIRENVPQAWAKIRGKAPSEAAAILQADPLVAQAWAAAREIEKPAVVTVKPAAQVDLENALAAQRSAEILEQNMPPQPISPIGPVVAESEEALRRQASPIAGRNAEFSAQAFEDQAAVQSVAQGDLERAIAARQGAAPEQIPDPARVQAEAFARELPPVEPPPAVELSAQAQQMQDADGWADGVIRRAFKGGRVSSNAFLDPELAAAVSVKGAQLLAKGAKDYDNWGGLMSKEFGEAVRPHLKDLWAKSNSASVMKTPEEFLRASVGDTAENLRMKLGKRPGTGTAKNALVEFEDLQGRPIAVGADKNFGGKPFGVWTSETEKWLSDPDISTFRQWYNELNQKFVSTFGEKRAPTMMMAWLAAQQNVSPGGALGNVFKVEDRLAGIGVGKKGGLADKKIEGVLTQQVQSGGFGAKLTDFVDAGFMRRVRSYMGGDVRGGEPFVADVHTGRDSGHVDHQTLSRLKDKADEGNLFIAGKPVTVKVTQTKTLQQGEKISRVPTRVRVTAEGMKPFGLNIDQTGSPSGPRYEGISEWGNALTRDLNEKQWKGGNWTPSEVQAVGWMRTLRQYGLPEESVESALAKNTGRVYAEVNYSSGATLPNALPSFGQLPYPTQQAITKEVLEQAVPMVADMVGGSLRVRNISMGDGIFGGQPAPSVAVELLGSTEAIDLFAVALAHASEQAATMSATFGLGGKNSRSIRFKKSDGSPFSGAEISSLADDAKLSGFSVHQLPGGNEALIVDADSNFTPKAFTEKKVQQIFDRLTTWADVRNVALDVDSPTTKITAYANDWSRNQKGQAYLEILNRRGIGSKVRDLDGLRGQYRTLVEQAFDRYAPGVRQGREGVLSSPPGMDAGTGAKTGSRQPNETVRKIADDYNAQSGQTPIEHGHYVAVNESLAQRIAKAYDALPEVSRSPETIKAYEALAKEVGDQWDFAVKNLGITFEPWTKEGQPYANSREMVKDVRDNNHIYFFQGGDPHPFLNAVDPKTGFTANDKLRAVHDLFGHAAEDYQFGPRGEENAWIKHSQMFSPEAQRALSSETRGQNSWVNFGAQNYENGVNKNIPAKDRPFAAQKTALLPKELTDWRSALGKSEPVGTSKKQIESTDFKNWFGDWQDPKAFTSRAKGPVSQVFKDGKPLVVYHATTKDFDAFESGRPTFDDMGFFGNVETNRHAIFFSDSPEQAGSYVTDSRGRADTGARTIPAYLDMKSPLYLDRNTRLDDLAEETGVNYNWLQNRRTWWELLDGEDGKGFVEGLKKAGYDGIVFDEDPIRPGVKVGTTYAVFQPTQIKSATGNSGRFNPQNPNIAGFAYNPLLTNLGGAAGGFVYGFSEDPKASPEDRLTNALKFAAAGGLAPSVARRAISAFAARPKTPIGPRSAQTMTLEGQKKMFEHAPDAATTAEIVKRFPGKVISEFQNALHEITRVEEKLRGSRPDLPMGDRFSLIAGAAGKAEAAFEPLLKLRNDLLKDMEPSDLNVYLFNKRTIDRLTTQAKNEAAGLDKPSREVLDYEIADAQRLLRDQEAQLGPDKWQRLEAFSNAYQKDADDNLRMVLASGLMNQKQYDQIKADNGFYAPFKVMKHLYGREGMEGVNTSSSMGSSTPFTKAVSGVTDQELKLGDMMVAAAENKLRAQVLAEKNMMMADFADLATLDTNGAFVRRLAPNAKVPDGWEKVSYAKDGLVQNLAVTPEIAKSLKGLNPAQLGVYTGALKTLSTGLRVGATTALVAFQTFNHLRDQFRMTVMSKAGVRSVDDLVQFPLDYLEGLGSSLLKPFGYNTSLSKEYLASGAAGSTMSSNLRDNPYMRAAQAGNHAPVARLLGIPVESIIDTAAKIGNVLEETTKMTGYRRVARSENLNNLTGKAQKEALERIAYEVRNYVGSPDFAKAGNIGRELNAIFMFYNARLQGQTADMRRLIGRSGGPKEAAIAASKLTLMVGIPTTYIWFMNQRPENEQDYNSLSKFEKMAYLNIPRYDDNGQPFYRENSKGAMVRQYYRAPKFDIYSQMANLVEGGLNFSKTKDPMALAKAGESFLEGLSPLPISGDTLAQRAESVVSGMNPAVKTLVELGTGRNTFRHQPIVPRNLENASPEKQYTDATPEFFKRAAAAVPQSFGPSFRSPLQLERITENLTGGALTQLMKKTPEGVDPRKSNPVLSRFFSGPNVANEETWDLLDKLRTSDADLYIERDRKLKDLVKRKGTETWPAEVLSFIQEDPESNGRAVLQALKDETAGTTDVDRTARRLSQESRAAYANTAMEKAKTPEGKARILRQLVERGVVDRGTLLEMEVHKRLLEKKP